MRKTFTFLLASLFISLLSFGQNRALHFDGGDDYVQVPARAGVLTGSTITFEAWVRPSSLSYSFMPIVNRGYSSNFFLVSFENMDMFSEQPGDIKLHVFLYNGSVSSPIFSASVS